jgi:hypothetical protein
MSDNKSTGVRIQLLSNGHIGTSHALPANTYVEDIACYAASLCYALGGDSNASPVSTDELFPINPTTGAVGKAITLKSFSGTGLTCISATGCLVVGFKGSGATAEPGVTVVSNGSPGPVTIYPGVSLDGIACATTTRCWAVGLGKSDAVVDKVAA